MALHCLNDDMSLLRKRFGRHRMEHAQHTTRLLKPSSSNSKERRLRNVNTKEGTRRPAYNNLMNRHERGYLAAFFIISAFPKSNAWTHAIKGAANAFRQHPASGTRAASVGLDLLREHGRPQFVHKGLLIHGEACHLQVVSRRWERMCTRPLQV